MCPNYRFSTRQHHTCISISLFMCHVQRCWYDITLDVACLSVCMHDVAIAANGRGCGWVLRGRVEWKRDGWEDERDGWIMKSAAMMGADGCDFRPGAVFSIYESTVALWFCRFLGRIASTQCNDANYCYRCCSVCMCLSVCLSVCHNSEPFKNGWTDQDDSCGVDSVSSDSRGRSISAVMCCFTTHLLFSLLVKDFF